MNISLPIHGVPGSAGPVMLSVPFDAKAAAAGRDPFACMNLGQARTADGKPFQLSLTPTDVHQPEELSTFLQGYKAFPFRADEMSEVVKVDHDEDYYRTMSADNAFVHIPVKGSINGRIPMIDPESDLDRYKVQHSFLGTFVNKVTERNATKAYRPRQEAMKTIQTKLQLDREVDVIGMLTENTNWGTDQQELLGAGFQWNDGGSSNPVKDLQDRITDSDQPVTEIWISEAMKFVLLRHASVRDQMRQFLGDSPAAAQAAASEDPFSMQDFVIPGIGRFKVSSAKKKNLTTGKVEYIWPIGTVVLLTKSPGGVDSESIATTKTFRTSGPQGTGYSTREFQLDAVGPEGGTVIVVYRADVPIMTGPNCGGIIEGAYQ